MDAPTEFWSTGSLALHPQVAHATGMIDTPLRGSILDPLLNNCLLSKGTIDAGGASFGASITCLDTWTSWTSQLLRVTSITSRTPPDVVWFGHLGCLDSYREPFKVSGLRLKGVWVRYC